MKFTNTELFVLALTLSVMFCYMLPYLRENEKKNSVQCPYLVFFEKFYNKL